MSILPDTVEGLVPKVQDGSITLSAVISMVKERLGTWADLNAFITLMIDDVREDNAQGPLAGVPVAVKDFYDTAGVKTTAGSERFANRVPARDARLVQALKAAGALIVGKTNMHEMGMGTTGLDSHFGPVRNPWNADLVPGGSSAGSAAAVAAGLCYATVDTDAVGSARLPAACCGVVGFKPSFGVLSADGILAGEEADPTILALSHPSIIARSATDADTVFRVLTADSAMAAAKLEPRVAVAKNYEASKPVRSQFQTALDEIAPLAAAFGFVDVPFSEASFSADGIETARAGINDRLFAEADLILLPTLADLVPTVEQAWKDGPQAVSPANTLFANYFGLPAITVPMAFSERDGPLALQIVGPQGDDLTVLAFAKLVQSVLLPRLAERRTGSTPNL